MANDNHSFSIEDAQKYGVYVDYFDSVGIKIMCGWIDGHKYTFNIEMDNATSIFNFEVGIKTMHEARTKAIEKAVEIYNNK